MLSGELTLKYVGYSKQIRKEECKDYKLWRVNVQLRLMVIRNVEKRLYLLLRMCSKPFKSACVLSIPLNSYDVDP